MRTPLTQHFTLEEFIESSTAERLGIDNTPPDDILATIRETAEGLELVRTALGDRPVIITSGYRCPALNKAINGALESQHMDGEAADCRCPEYGPPIEVCRRLIFVGVPFDQLILEFSWVHISFVPGMPRGRVLTRLRDGSYVVGLKHLA